MPFWGFHRVHPDHNLWKFVYLHQGSQIFYFKCDLKEHVLKDVRRVKTTKCGGDLLSKAKHRLELPEAKGF